MLSRSQTASCHVSASLLVIYVIYVINQDVILIDPRQYVIYVILAVSGRSGYFRGARVGLFPGGIDTELTRYLLNWPLNKGV